MMRRLVGIYELDPIDVIDGEPLCFRLEIFVDHSNECFTANVLRWETTKLSISFVTDETANSGLIADYRVLVEDDVIDTHNVSGSCADDVLNQVIRDILEKTSRRGPV